MLSITVRHSGVQSRRACCKKIALVPAVLAVLAALAALVHKTNGCALWYPRSRSPQPTEPTEPTEPTPRFDSLRPLSTTTTLPRFRVACSSCLLSHSSLPHLRSPNRPNRPNTAQDATPSSARTRWRVCRCRIGRSPSTTSLHSDRPQAEHGPCHHLGPSWCSDSLAEEAGGLSGLLELQRCW